MKITVEFESLEEFEKHFTLNNINFNDIAELKSLIVDSNSVLKDAISKTYQDGADIIVDKILAKTLTADIKDSDLVAEDYDENLYKKVKSKFDDLLAKNPLPRHQTIIKDWIFRVTQDYEVRPGLSTDAYNQLLANAESVEEAFS